jgi:Domain of unknown function (DUF4157)
MFAPPVARAQKAAESPTSKLAPRRSTLASRLLVGGAAEQAHTLQRGVGNRAPLRLLSQPVRYLTENVSRAHDEQEADQASLSARGAMPGVSWDFSKIPLFPPDRPNRLRTPSPFTVPPLTGAITAVQRGPVTPVGATSGRVTATHSPKSDARRLSPMPHALVPVIGHAFSRLRVHTTGSFELPDRVLPHLPTGLQPAARQTRLHDDDFAHRATKALNVEAVTAGKHIYFNRNRWHPETHAGRALLEHELGHVSRREGCADTIEAWSSEGHRTITRQALANDSRFSAIAVSLLANTAPVPDYNRPQILQDMVSFWSGESLWRAPAGLVAGGVIGAITPPEQGTQLGRVRLGGLLPQAVLGTGLIPTVPAKEQVRGSGGQARPELQRTRVTQELASHGEDLPERNEGRMNEYVDQGVAMANRCDMYHGLVGLGCALHVAQDRGSHGDGYTADYVQNRPHAEIDDMSANPQGLAVALTHSHECTDRFFNGLSEVKRTALASPLTLQSDRPPVLETMLPGQSTQWANPPSTTAPGSGPQPTGGVNILSITF